MDDSLGQPVAFDQRSSTIRKFHYLWYRSKENKSAYKGYSSERDVCQSASYETQEIAEKASLSSVYDMKR